MDNFKVKFDLSRKYKNLHKFVFKDKINPLQNEFDMNDKKYPKFIVRLKSYAKILNLINIKNGYDTLYKHLQYQIWKISQNEHKKYESFLLSRIIYVINQENSKIRIFGGKFVGNNKNKCFIIYNNKVLPLQEYFPFENIQIEDNILKIFLIEFEDIYNRSYMFNLCSSLEGISFINEKETRIDKEKFEK